MSTLDALLLKALLEQEFLRQLPASVSKIKVYLARADKEVTIGALTISVANLERLGLCYSDVEVVGEFKTEARLSAFTEFGRAMATACTYR